jgi:Uma2 family endonuclease
MNTMVVEGDFVRIPDDVKTLEAFRRWAQSEDFPEFGRICYLRGDVWVDMSKEQFFSHNQVKNEYNIKLGSLAKALRVGRYVPDGMLLTNDEADLSAQPDGIFITNRSLRLGRVRLVEGVREGYLELEGSPDMVLEIMSTSSVEKDTLTLRELYWRAGIREYWLVDARGEALEFDILRRTPAGYVPTRKQAGWIKSAVFRRSFKLVRRLDKLGHPDFTLKVR